MGSVDAQNIKEFNIIKTVLNVCTTSDVRVVLSDLTPNESYRLYWVVSKPFTFVPKSGFSSFLVDPNWQGFSEGVYLPFTATSENQVLEFRITPKIYVTSSIWPYLIGWEQVDNYFDARMTTESDPSQNIALGGDDVAFFAGARLRAMPNGVGPWKSSSVNFDDFKSANNSVITLNKFYIDDKMEIDETLTLVNQASIFFGPSGSLEIAPNKTFRVKGSKFQNACNESWDGITLKEGAQLLIEGDPGQPTARSLINGARIGIDSRFSSKLFCFDTDFKNNYIGVNHDGQQSSFDFDISNCKFFGMGTMPAIGVVIQPFIDNFQPIQPYAGVRLCNNTNYNAMTGVNNQFYNMENGIILKNSSGDFSSCKFRDIRGLYLADNINAGNAIIARSTNLFDSHSLFYKGQNNAQSLDVKDCDFGIMTNNYSLILKEAHFDNIKEIGVEVSDCLLKQSKIENNVIEAGTSSIRMFGNFWSGIDVVDNYLNVFSGVQGASACVDMAFNDNLSFGLAGSSGGITIRNNFLNNFAQGQGVRSIMDVFPVIKNNYFTTNDMKYGDGIRLDGGSLAYALCNNFSQPLLGTAGQEASAIRTFLNPNSYISCNSEVKYPQGLTFLGTSTGSIIKGNSFNQNRRGLLYEFDAITGKQPELVPSVSQLHGNDWNGYTYPNMQGARHNGTTDNIVKQSLYTVNPASYPTHTTSISVANSALTWFSNISQYQTFSCADQVAPLKCGNNGPLTPLVIPSNPDSADVFVVLDSIDSEHFPNSYKWIAKRQVYDKLLRWPTMINSKTVFAPFYNTNVSSSIGQFSNMKRNINRAALIPGFNDTGYRLQLSGIDSLENLLRQAVGQPSPNQQVILQLENAIVQARNTISQSSASNMLLRNARLTNLDAINGAINAQAIYEQNEKLVNDVKISYLIQGMSALDSLTMVNMIEIAAQCPLIGGESVFGARYLVSRKINLNWDDYDLCESNQSRSKKTENIDLVNGAVLSPNPFTNQLQVNFEGNEMKELRIYDMKGVVVHKSQVLSGQQVDVGDLLSGFYIAELTGTGKASIKLKLIKL